MVLTVELSPGSGPDAVYMCVRTRECADVCEYVHEGVYSSVLECVPTCVCGCVHVPLGPVAPAVAP